MKVSDYVKEVSHAVETVLGEIHKEHDQLARLRSEVSRLTAATDDGYQRSDFLALNPDLDDEGIGTASYSDTYFGPDKERFYKSAEAEAAAARIATHEFSVAALAGALLQYGKQGLSVRFGKHRKGCPEGRLVAGFALAEVIWQGRNQALHWEEGVFSESVVKCFAHLTAHDPVFAQYKQRNMAYEVVRLLGWKTIEDFRKDMSLFDL